MFTNAGEVSKEFNEKMREVNSEIEYTSEGVPKILFQESSNKESLNEDYKNGKNKEDNKGDSTTEPTENVLEETRRKNPFFCVRCTRWRPERSHHCRTCGKCVLRYDHHCPWIANCVGYKNHKNFVQFLFYATLGDLVAFICLLIKLLELDLDIMVYIRKKYPYGIPQAGLGIFDVLGIIKEPLILLMGTVFSFAMTIAIGGLLVYQVWNISYGLTSIESNLKIGGKVNTKFQNFKEFMVGNNIYNWLEPFSEIPDPVLRYFRPRIVRNKLTNVKIPLVYSLGEVIKNKESTEENNNNKVEKTEKDEKPNKQKKNN